LKSFAAVLTILFVLSPSFVEAQTRGRRTTSSRRAAPTLAASRGRVAERIKVLTRFIYLYGGIANEIEVAEERTQRGGNSADLRALTNQRRAALQTGVRDVRDGLEQLEQDFRTTAGLQRHYARLSGVAAAAADAEESIAAGRLKQAGQMLLQIVNQLTDTLSEM
jgi:hypothetical protein